MLLHEVVGFEWNKKKQVEQKDHVSPPSHINRNHLELILRLIIAGSQISTVNMLPEMLRNAKLIAYTTLGDDIISVAVLKTPNDSYREKIFTNAGIQPIGYDVELGYLVTHQDHRGQGLSNKLVNLLLHTYKGKMYSTTRQQNHI
jgi:predicted GNAT family N-acyltransferase